MSARQDQPHHGMQSEYSNSVIQQYIQAAKEKLERERADGATRSQMSDYTRFPQTPTPAVLTPPPPQEALAFPQHPSLRPQWQARSASNGAIPVVTNSARSSSEFGHYTTDQGSPQYPPTRQQYNSSPPSPYRSSNHRRASSNLYPHGHTIQTIPEDRESGTMSSLYTATSRARSTHTAANSQDLEQDSLHGEEEEEEELVMHEAGRGLVREASVGRKHRPTLTQIGTSESWSRRTSEQGIPPSDPRLGIAPATGPEEPPPMPSITLLSPHLLSPNSSGESVFASGTGYVSPSASTFSDDISKHESPLSVRHLRPSPGARGNLTQQTEQRQSSRPYTADSANSSGSFRLGKETGVKSKLSERVGTKKPEPLKLELVKEAETRGSLTSLPDLIKRALRLASNLEMGKTASRFGTDWMFEGDGEKKSAANGRRRNSLGSMINSFPSTPRPESPGIRRGLGPYSVMPKSAGLQSALRRSFTPNKALDQDRSDEKPQRKRKCCGMPMWAFLLILLTIILLICAAVLIPICLIVIPNSHRDTNCVSTHIGNTNNARIGSAIPSLLQNANSSFGIPLDEQVIYQLFANAKMSCTEENALVSLNPVNQKRSLLARRILPYQQIAAADQYSSSVVDSLVAAPTPLAAHIMDTHNHHIHNSLIGLAPRQQPAATTFILLSPPTTTPTAAAAATSNGIVFAMSMSSTTPTPTATSIPASSSTTSTTSPSDTPTNTPFTPSITSLTLARTSILYILQSTQSLSAAQTAQSLLAAFFANPAAQGGEQGARSVSVGGGWVVDLVGGGIMGAEGERVGGGV